MRIYNPYLAGDINVDDVAMFVRRPDESPITFRIRIEDAAERGFLTADQARRLIAYDEQQRGFQAATPSDVEFASEARERHKEVADPYYDSKKPITSKIRRWWACADIVDSPIVPDSVEFAACKTARVVTIGAGVLAYVLAMWTLDKMGGR